MSFRMYALGRTSAPHHPEPEPEKGGGLLKLAIWLAITVVIVLLGAAADINGWFVR